MNTTVREIAGAVGGRILCGDPETVLRHISTDSRQSEGDDLFVPVEGARVDGHRFIPQAFDNGCAASLTSRTDVPQDPAHPLILVEDTIEALHDIGRFLRKGISLPAVGVTGSVGKTTTREMVAAAISGGLKVFKTGKNYNSSIGLPITISQMSDDYDIAVLELGMNVPGELGMISDIADLTAAVITNIGTAHMEYYGSQEAICREKFTITRGFHRGGILFLNGDDPLLVENAGLTGFPYVFYGTDPRCSYRAVNLDPRDGCYAFDLVHEGKSTYVSLSVPGRHNVLNAAAAMAVADHFGVDPEAAAAALGKFTGFANRLQVISAGPFTVIDDTYNASPDSMEAGLGVLSDRRCAGRKIAVLGEMRELGPDSASLHHGVGTAAAGAKIDGLIVVGAGAAPIADGAEEGKAPYPVIRVDGIPEAEQTLAEILQPGDTIYLKASNAVHLSELTDFLRKEGLKAQ